MQKSNRKTRRWAIEEEEAITRFQRVINMNIGALTLWSNAESQWLRWSSGFSAPQKRVGDLLLTHQLPLLLVTCAATFPPNWITPFWREEGDSADWGSWWDSWSSAQLSKLLNSQGPPQDQVSSKPLLAVELGGPPAGRAGSSRDGTLSSVWVPTYAKVGFPVMQLPLVTHTPVRNPSKLTDSPT